MARYRRVRGWNREARAGRAPGRIWSGHRTRTGHGTQVLVPGASRQRNPGRVRSGVEGLGLVKVGSGQYRWRSCGGYFPRCTHGASRSQRTHLARAASRPLPLDGGDLALRTPASASNEGSASPLDRGKGTEP
jgi:hypothetical protein